MVLYTHHGIWLYKEFVRKSDNTRSIDFAQYVMFISSVVLHDKTYEIDYSAS